MSTKGYLAVATIMVERGRLRHFGLKCWLSLSLGVFLNHQPEVLGTSDKGEAS
jgi:hypothetical protein